MFEDGSEETLELSEGSVVLGRRPRRGGKRLKDEYLSRSHCRLTLEKGRLTVEDLESYNGTWVNGRRIHEACFLDSGDVLKIGRSRLLVQGESAEASDGVLPKVYAPKLPRRPGFKVIEQTKSPRLTAPYREINESADKASRRRRTKARRSAEPASERGAGADSGSDSDSNRDSDSGSNEDTDLAGAMESTRSAAKTRRARPLNLDEDIGPPPSLSGSTRYRPPRKSDTESETPTPIPDPDFTASAIRRSGPKLEEAGRDRLGLRAVAQLARVLHSIDDIGDFLNHAVGRILEVVPAERALLMRLDRRRRGLHIEVARSAVADRDDSEARKLGVSHTIARRVVRDRVSVLVNDASIDARFRDASSIQSLQIRSILCAPIWYEDRVRGLIYLDHLMHAYAFSEADRECLVAIANLVALGLEQKRRR